MTEPETVDLVANIVGRSKELARVLTVIKKVAPYKSTVLLTGESGTGKELFAKAIHALSPRAGRPMIVVNCGAIPENLLEAELFGHVKGAYTGAVSTQEGLFEKAQGGTVFLDEVGELPLEMQVKLLRAIQEEEIMKVGDRRPIKLDIRIVAATNKDLGTEVNEGRFREDLHYRLNVVHIQIPPLRDRLDDLPVLSKHFIEKFAARLDKRVAGISAEALGMLMNYDWPGNVRELENVFEQTIVLMEEGAEIVGADLPIFLERRGYERRNRFRQEALDKKLSITDYTKDFITRFQDQHTEKELAQYLGITTKTLWEKRKAWNMPRTRR
ncbi:MAG: sigma 54-interacting transcriptional regulator [Deltaproteobacteria bacterium]|nr:sigma 54-interacting transcriptional regulator [Deltaproteobacteria bacterium]